MMVLGTYAVKIEVQMAFAQISPDISARLSEGGGGVRSLFEQCPFGGCHFLSGASLKYWNVLILALSMTAFMCSEGGMSTCHCIH